MNRKDFLTGTLSAMAIAPMIALGKVVDATRTRRVPLEPLESGDILTTEYLAEIVDRLNELESGK